jgi:6-phosphogluconolactonase
VFHPNGRFAYVINEHGNTMVAFAYDAATGALTELQTLPTLPGGFTEKSYCADVQVHPSGKFLYGSNRGHDSIVIYAIDPSTGRMTLVGHEPTQGSYPRSFEIEPSGNFLVVGNEKGNNLVIFRIDAVTGKLTPTGHRLEVVAPACMWLVR